jgi:hypothetical protein
MRAVQQRPERMPRPHSLLMKFPVRFKRKTLSLLCLACSLLLLSLLRWGVLFEPIQPSFSVPDNHRPFRLAVPSSSRAPSTNVFRLAIVVTGSFHRWIFQSSMKRFIRPLSRQGHHVDYYLSLSMQKAPAYRSDQNYMNLQVSDPIFDQYIYHEDRATLLDIARRKEQIHRFVHQQFNSSGANLRYTTFQDNYDGMDHNLKVIQHRKQARQMYPHEDSDLRFPVLDIRNAAVRNRTANANRNMLHLFYHIQHVYQQVLAYETEIRIKYDYVLFLRDDAMWLQSFDFRSLVEGSVTTAATTRTDASSTHVELFIPSCDARVPSMHPMEINDHIMVLKRDRADVYGNYFDELFRTDMDRCAQRLDDGLRYGRVIPQSNLPVPSRGCNSEMILLYILEQNNVKTQKVGQGKIPFERMVFVKHPITSKVQSCFHYFCQSHVDPLIIPSGMEKCTELNVDAPV